MILERIDKSGHILDSYILNTNTISIGRGYDNDLIVHDPHVDALQANISFDSSNNNFHFTDLHSTNGFTIHSRKPKKCTPGTEVVLASGDCFSIGKTRFRVFSTAHPVPPTHTISWLDTFNVVLGHWWALIVLTVIAIGLDVLITYLNMPYSDELLKDNVGAVYTVVPALVYGLVWILIARVQRQESHFLFHINLLLLGISIMKIYSLVVPIISFNAPAIFSEDYFISFILALGVFFIIYSSSYQSTGLAFSRRISFSVAIPVLILTGVGIQIINKPEFNSNPEYKKDLVPTDYQWRSSESVFEFLEQTNELYQTVSDKAIERHQRHLAKASTYRLLPE
ncbi:MAG: FHA domain-containing protein [Gammaproteobacteria bacterium]|nr:FHA domain-containing protein [Gammaproteobacteria bacterium]